MQSRAYTVPTRTTAVLFAIAKIFFGSVVLTTATSTTAVASTECRENNAGETCVRQFEWPIRYELNGVSNCTGLPETVPPPYSSAAYGSVGAAIGRGISERFCENPTACDIRETAGNLDTLIGGASSPWTKPRYSHSRAFRLFYPDEHGACTVAGGRADVAASDQAPITCAPGTANHGSEDGGARCGAATYYCNDCGSGKCANGGSGCTGAGNPISVGTGEKTQVEVDYPGVGGSLLKLVRYYNSRGAEAIGTAGSPLALGHPVWRTNYDVRLLEYTDPSSVTSIFIEREDGQQIYFKKSGSVYLKGLPDYAWQLEKLGDGTWKLSSASDEIEAFDAQGRLTSITNREGVTVTLAYDGSSLYTTATDSFGRVITFSRDGEGRLSGFTDPAGNAYGYQYNAITTALSQVTYPDTKTRIYHYENTTYYFALTGITDEKGNRYSTYTYDSFGGGATTELAGGVNKFTRAATWVTNALGLTAGYSFATGGGGAIRNIGIEKLAPGMGTNDASSIWRNSDGNIDRRYDHRGNHNRYTWDAARALETQRIEAFGTAAQRVITTDWHSTWRAPKGIAEPLKRTTIAYNGDPSVSCAPSGASSGLPCTRTEQATADPDGSGLFLSSLVGNARTWTYTYNLQGQVKTVDGPRTDVTSDVTTYDYYTSNDSSGYFRTGDLASITNALGHVIQFTHYDGNGRLLRSVDPNGLETRLEYWPRGWLKSRQLYKAGSISETTLFDYEVTGNLSKVTRPDGSWVHYSYDDAHRLNGVDDSAGNSIDYTMDLMGNRLEEKFYDSSDTLKQKVKREFNNLAQLVKDFTWDGYFTTYEYDEMGNRKKTIPPSVLAKPDATNSFDELNRLIQATDPGSGNTKFTYDKAGQITKITDPANLETTYTVDGLGNQTQLVSPDTGTTAFTYDAAGNLKTKTDARGVLATYTYDKLNRVTLLVYPDETVTYGYDSCTNGVGRLCSINDKTGTTGYSYDAAGRITTKSQAMAGSVTLVVGYEYNAAGQLSRIVMPSGQAVGYTYANNRPVSVKVNNETILSSAVYEPFGPNGGWRWGNSASLGTNDHLRIFDLNYRFTEHTSDKIGTIIRGESYNYDAASRLAFLMRSGGEPGKAYGYDALDRMTSAQDDQCFGCGPPLGPTGPQYTYDSVGNRLSTTGYAPLGEPYSTLSYYSGSHRLKSSSPDWKVFSYDAMGNLIGENSQNWMYGGNGRMTRMINGALNVPVLINALGQRVGKGEEQAGSIVSWKMNGTSIVGTGDLLLGANTGYSLQHVADLNGDGTKDLIVRNRDGAVTAWIMNSSGTIASSGQLRAAGPWKITHTGDFNGDGKADLVWQHPDKSVEIWLMNGLTATTTTTLWGDDSPYVITHLGDFNGDGKDDIVGRALNGDAAIWLMNGTSATSSSVVLNGTEGWRLVQVGDLNGDGKADLIWRHTDNRAVAWLMNGLTASSSPLLANSSIGPGWEITHLADLNGDGKQDLIWQNSDGSLSAWLMNGGTILDSTLVWGAGDSWRATHFADFNGDGKADMVGRDSAGNTAMWLMNGLSPTSSAVLLNGTEGWSVTHVGDVNGNGKADILWNQRGTVPALRFVYDEAGKLIGEYDAAGNAIQEHAWLDELPVAVVRPSGTPSTPLLYYVHADHLGTPRDITRASDNGWVWTWKNMDPFGANIADANPSSLGEFSYNLGLPGQYLDGETGKYYNYFRDYDPSSGRYIESDPIGLGAGVNTYAYVRGAPLAYADPLGLAPGPSKPSPYCGSRVTRGCIPQPKPVPTSCEGRCLTSWNNCQLLSDFYGPSWNLATGLAGGGIGNIVGGKLGTGFGVGVGMIPDGWDGMNGEGIKKGCEVGYGKCSAGCQNCQ
jgi:RHS repeat-associated protein